jgi:cell division protein FtsL
MGGFNLSGQSNLRSRARLHDVSTKIKLNRWTIFLLIVASALAMIFYVDNVMRVNDLLVKIQTLEKRHADLQSSNAVLDRRLNELQSADRIIPLASRELGLAVPKQAPERLP